METKSYDYTEDEYQEAFEKVKRDYVGQAKSEKSPRLILQQDSQHQENQHYLRR